MLSAEQRQKLFHAPLLPAETQVVSMPAETQAVQMPAETQVAIYDSQSTVNPPEIMQPIRVKTPSSAGFRETQQVKQESFQRGGPHNDTGITYKVKHVNQDFLEEYSHQLEFESTRQKQERLAANPSFLVNEGNQLDQDVYSVIEKFIAGKRQDVIMQIMLGDLSIPSEQQPLSQFLQKAKPETFKPPIIPKRPAPSQEPSYRDVKVSRVQQNIDYSKKLISDSRQFEDQLMQGNVPDFMRPPNKQGPMDWKKKQECASLVRKIKEEKREREQRLAEQQRKHDEKVAIEIEERTRALQQKFETDQNEKERKRMEVEQRRQERIESRQRSIGEMIERTKAITTSKNRPVEYTYVQKDQEVGQKIDAKNLKSHSLRYEEIIRKSKDDLKRKRRLDPVSEDTEQGEAVLPSVKERSRALRDAGNRELLAKIQMQDRSKNYSKQVKDVNMPRTSSTKVFQGDQESLAPAQASRGASATDTRPPKPVKRVQRQKTGNNADLDVLHQQFEHLPTFGQNSPLLANENFIEKIKAKLDMLDQM